MKSMVEIISVSKRSTNQPVYHTQIIISCRKLHGQFKSSQYGTFNDIKCCMHARVQSHWIESSKVEPSSPPAQSFQIKCGLPCVVGRVLKGKQIFALRMVEEDGASLKDAGRVHDGKTITVQNMVPADAI